MNQGGDGNMTMFAIPPTRKNTPISNPIFMWLFAASFAAMNAPTSVPRACARKGNRKCLGSKRCMEALSPSMVVMSASVGGGITFPLMVMSAMFTMLPTSSPAITASMFLIIGFILFVIG